MCHPVRENVPALAEPFPTFGTLERSFTRVTTLVCLILVRKRVTVLVKVELTVLLPFCEKLLPQPGNSHSYFGQQRAKTRTDYTYIGFLAGVCSDVALELRLLREALVASIKVTMEMFLWFGSRLGPAGTTVGKVPLVGTKSVMSFGLSGLRVGDGQLIDLSDYRRDVRLGLNDP